MPNMSDAQAVLSSEDRVPRNTAYACVANSYVYYPAPNYKSYFYDERTTGLLKPNMEEYIERLRQDLSKQADKEISIENRIREANHEKMTHKTEIETNEMKMRQMKTKVRSLHAQILNMKNEEVAERPPDISALEEDLDKNKKALEASNQELSEVRKELESKREEYTKAKESYEVYQQKLISLADEAEPLKSELNKIETDLKVSKANKEHYEGRKKDFKREIAGLEASIAGKEENLLEFKGKAMSWSSERIDSRKKVESLQKEIYLMEESLKQQEDQQESRQLVTEKYQVG